MTPSNRVIGYYPGFTGGQTACPTDPAIVMRAAINTPGTTNLILAHNNPSGALKASRADIRMTHRMVEAAGLLDIKVLDHIIMPGDMEPGQQEQFFSFLDEGMM